MPLAWPGTSSSGGDLADTWQSAIRTLLDQWADGVLAGLRTLGLPPHASPVFRPWNLYVAVDKDNVVAAFTPRQGDIASMRWLDLSSQSIDPLDMARDIQARLGAPVHALVVLPRTAIDGANEDASVVAEAARHVAEVERANRLGRLGDLTGLAHLEPFLRTFLADHPAPERNVFIMMRFIGTQQLNEIYHTIKATLSESGFDGIRADERDYTGELWSNVETQMVGCHFGIAVFEDIEKRDFNPNVSLELGYMLGRRRRCLILKEQRLPDLPADVMHRLYKPFDVFNIAATVRSQVLRWIQVDLGYK